MNSSYVRQGKQYNTSSEWLLSKDYLCMPYYSLLRKNDLFDQLGRLFKILTEASCAMSL